MVSSRPSPISSSTRARISARRRCGRAAVGGQAVVGVALDLLRARAVGDLGAERAADRRLGRAGDRDDRVVEVGHPRRVRRRRDGHQRGVADVAAVRRLARSTATWSPKWRRIALAAAAIALDVGPDLAVLAPAGAAGLVDRVAAEAGGALVEAAQRSGRRRGRAPTGSGEITPARVRWPSSERSCSLSMPSAFASSAAARRSEAGRGLGPRLGAPSAVPSCERLASRRGDARCSAGGQALRQVLVDLLALDEVHVQRLVAVLGQQQCASRLRRRGPRGPPPGSRPRAKPARSRG